MNILVTGATGFIGKYLTGDLSKTHSVRCLVRKTSDIKVLRNFNVDIAYGDLLVKESLGPALDGIDLVYHLAGEVYSRRKQDYYKGNVLATHNLLEACKEKGTKRIIFLSTTAVYKLPDTKTLLTEESECKPISIYGRTKLAAEESIKKSNIPWIIVRSTVVYGPHQPSAVNKFFTQALVAKKIYVIGDGDNLRSLCFIQNLIDGLLLLADKKDISQETFIFSDTSPLTLNEIIVAASAVTKQRIKIIHLPYVLGNISGKIYSLMGCLFSLYFVELFGIKMMRENMGYDIAKATTEIGYNPKVTLLEGIRNTAEWISASRSSECQR
jgi:dihydroflavonol-4-reductase